MTLLERDAALQDVQRAIALSSAAGQLVAVFGEAGIGKTSLLRAAAAGSRTRWLWGYCEALRTPRPLGPLADIAPDLYGATAVALSAGVPRHDVFLAFVADLAKADGPVVICVEDVHWADDSTLDWLQFTARRLDRLRVTVLVTYRDEEMPAEHSLTRVLSAAPPASVHRIALAPLSLEAIAQLSGARADAPAVHALTRGNPFFVTEVLSSPDSIVPASVRDAVLARRSRLDEDTRAVLDLVSVVPSRLELTLLREALNGDLRRLDACLAVGLLHADAETVAFKHELARRAVADALTPARAQALHQRILSALLSRSPREPLLARIVHHADAAGMVEQVLEFAPLAARQAASLGAHRQSVEQYRRVLRHVDRLSDADRATLIEALASEHYLTGDIAAARQARRDALAIWTRLSQTIAVARNTRWLSRLAWFAGDGAEAEACAVAAIDVLRDLPENSELAWAFSNRAQIAMLRNENEECAVWGDKAIALARKLDDREVLSHALNNVGTGRVQAGDLGGWRDVEESLRVALAGNFHEHVARAYTNLGATSVDRRGYAEARRWLNEGIAYCVDRDLDSWTFYMQGQRARMYVETGAWSLAEEDAEAVFAGTGALVVSRIVALTAQALIRVRRGASDAAAMLDQALELAQRTGEVQRVVPVLAARAEHAWFQGDRDRQVAEVRAALALPQARERWADHDRLLYWLWRAGELNPSEIGGDSAYAQLIRGDWRAAAAEWERAGCPYERGHALIEGDVDAVNDALAVFHALGAAPAADWARQRLRMLGVATLPRGKRASTLAHPAGLTRRETEVLALMAQGLTNPQIGDRLFVSAKTVEHHVSSILGKLAVETRDAAVSHARREGWLETARPE